MPRYITDPLAIFHPSSPLCPGGFPNFLGAGSQSRADGGSVWSTTGFQGEIWHKEMPRKLWTRGRCWQKAGMQSDADATFEGRDG